MGDESSVASLSRWAEVVNGVPQGSILGRYYFHYNYVNDLPSVIKHSNCYLYADDMSKVF